MLFKARKKVLLKTMVQSVLVYVMSVFLLPLLLSSELQKDDEFLLVG